MSDPAGVEQLRHSVSDLGPLERHAVFSEPSPEQAAEPVAERLEVGTLTAD